MDVVKKAEVREEVAKAFLGNLDLCTSNPSLGRPHFHLVQGHGGDRTYIRMSDTQGYIVVSVVVAQSGWFLWRKTSATLFVYPQVGLSAPYSYVGGALQHTMSYPRWKATDDDMMRLMGEHATRQLVGWLTHQQDHLKQEMNVV